MNRLQPRHYGPAGILDIKSEVDGENSIESPHHTFYIRKYYNNEFLHQRCVTDETWRFVLCISFENRRRTMWLNSGPSISRKPLQLLYQKTKTKTNWAIGVGYFKMLLTACRLCLAFWFGSGVLRFYTKGTKVQLVYYLWGICRRKLQQNDIGKSENVKIYENNNLRLLTTLWFSIAFRFRCSVFRFCAIIRIVQLS